MLKFPEGFLWGTATASYQIEGGVNEGGRGPSIWDVFSHTPGKVLNGDTGDVACDHFHRYEADAKLIGSLGLPAYRLSVAWPRIQPNGRGPANQAGLDFYSRLIEALRAQGVEPVVTLYHWDLPQALQDKGGWTVRETADRFAEFAGLLGGALGGQVGTWITLNEPWVSAFVGHELGHHAPGLTDTGAAVDAGHHLLLAHGKAVQALRAATGPQAKIGLTLSLTPIYPATPSAEDTAAAARVDAYINRWFLDPPLRGTYPEELHARLCTVIGREFVQDGDLEEIHAPIDFLGVNNYTTRRVAAPGVEDGPGRPDPEVERSVPLPRPFPSYLESVEVPASGVEHTTKGWAIQPDGLKELLIRLHTDYGGRPLYVTENGAAFVDRVDADGSVSDPERVRYLHAYFAAAHEAIEAGVDLRGYFVWSLLDNFEWADGYSQRFGLVYVDYETQERTIKASGRFVSDVARDNGISEVAP